MIFRCQKSDEDDGEGAAGKGGCSGADAGGAAAPALGPGSPPPSPRLLFPLRRRLRGLQQYWTTKVRGVPRVRLFTPSDPARTGAIANVGIDGMKPGDLATALMDRFKIFTVAIDTAGVTGVRVTPQLFTTTAELDAFVRAITQLAA